MLGINQIKTLKTRAMNQTAKDRVRKKQNKLILISKIGHRRKNKVV